MTPRLVVLALSLSCCLPSCQSGPSHRAPGTAAAEKNAGGEWWRQLNDPSLNRDVRSALSASPDLRAVALRMERAEAVVARARAAMQPRLNLGFGFSDGRRQAIDFGPYDFGPWQSAASLSWELDLSGKLRAARQSARESRQAAREDYQLARLLLASEVAAVRIRLYRFNAELDDLRSTLEASRKTTGYLAERLRAGLIADAVLDRQRAENERLVRQQLDLKRLRDLTVIQLRTLRGGSAPRETGRSQFPVPDDFSTRPLSGLLAGHPRLLASAARVRAAWGLEQAARLDLLPSFRLGALATGRQMSLTDRFMVWSGEVGPSLDLPVYDPARLARVKLRRAEARIAAAQYRQSVLNVLEDLDTARTNLASRRAQLATAIRETEALSRSRRQVREQFTAGLISQIDYLDIERRWLEAKRSQAFLRQAMLEARINLIKAAGGGEA